MLKKENPSGFYVDPFFRLNFSPTIYPPIICLKRLFSATCQKKEIPDNALLSGICLIFLLFSVIRLGYEPNVISSSISVLSEILALHPSRFSP